MSDNALMVQNNRLAVMPVMDNNTAMMRRQAVIDFTRSVMKPEIDYGRVPGTNKDTLLKPGAEKLTSLFGLSPRFTIVEKATDWTGKEHGNEPFFYFQYRCSLYYGDVLAGEGVGSCNSWEKKYRYRNAERTCPHCGKAAIIKGKAEYGGGWICFAKKGGCGAKFVNGAPEIESQEIGQVLNDNPADLVNTVDKMAQKRALVAAVLIAVNASEFFTQDIEDMDFGVIEGEFVEQSPKKQPQPRPNGNDNGHKPAQKVSFDDLGNDDSPGTIDEDKWRLFRSRVHDNPRNTVSTVCSAVTMTGAYRADSHALNAALSISADLERGMKLTTEEALSLFDKLIERKRQPQLIAVDTPVTDAGYAE